ncbi:hypothetical protein ND528_28105, partial [Pseudomonas sp. C98]|nr:hypothetical protein [Pseudomonas mercuritolerans]
MGGAPGQGATPDVAPARTALVTGASRGIGRAVAVGLAAGVLFMRRQLHRSNPMIDVRLFTRGAFSGAVLVNLLSVFSLVGFLFFVSQDVQLVLGLGPMQAGVALLPGLVVMIVAGLGVVRVVRRVRPAHVVAVARLFSATGYAIVAAGAGQSTLALLMVA